jgi:hypothetical protein
MSELPYSFHLGRNKNRTTSSRSNAKNNLSNSTSLANNGIQNYQQLSKVNNHDFRKYDQDTRGIYTLKGCNDIVYDVKQFYKTEFEEARLEYNNKQSRPSRRIDDYFEYVNKDEKRDLACEIIIELGNIEFWDTKDDEYKEKMVKVYSENLKCLEELVPEFKITNAVVHLDERSPHMHIVGVPVKDGCKTGLSKQVNKSSVFTKDRLEHIQNVMRDNCIKEFNKEYEENFTLKEKEKGRNKDIHIMDMVDYQELKKELEINKKSIDKSNEKIKSINKSASDFKNLLDDLEESRFGGYKLNNQQKGRLKDLLKDVESLTDYFDNYKNIINNLGAINENLKNQKEENKKLNRNNNDLIISNRKLTNKLKEQNNTNDLLKLVIRDKEDKHLDLVTYLCKHANSKDYTTSRLFKQMTMDLNDKGFISDKEHKVIFNPPKTINKSEINRALKSLNQQMEEAAEEFYKMNNNDDYSL